MPTYTYETIPADPAEPPVRFEVRQGMLDAPLTCHPDTGVPVKRVITGGLGIIGSSRSSSSSSGSGSGQPHGHRHSGGCCGGFR